MEGYIAEDGPYPGSIDNPIIWPMLSMKLQRNQTTTCTLVPLSRLNGDYVVEEGSEETKGGDSPAVPGTYPYTTEFRLAGKWVKILGV